MSDKVNHILVIKPSSMGDILHLFPALQFLHAHYPEAEIDFMVHPAFAPILDFAPCPIRRRIIFERGKLGKFPGCIGEFFKLRRELRREYYDLVIDFQGLMRSAFFAAMTRRRRLAGFAAPRERAARIFYSEKIPVSALLHAVERNWQLARRCAGLGTEGDIPECRIPAATVEYAPAGDRYLVVLPAARWESKTFPPELFAAVMKSVHRNHPEYTFVLAGTAEDSPAARAVAAELPPEFPCIDLTGKTGIRELFELIRRSTALLSNDSGPLHAAAVFHIPAFAFYGSTDPALTGPWGRTARVYQHTLLPCLGCLKRECPGGTETLCHQIDPEQTAADISAVLDAAGNDTDNKQ